MAASEPPRISIAVQQPKEPFDPAAYPRIRCSRRRKLKPSQTLAKRKDERLAKLPGSRAGAGRRPKDQQAASPPKPAESRRICAVLLRALLIGSMEHDFVDV